MFYFRYAEAATTITCHGTPPQRLSFRLAEAAGHAFDDEGALLAGLPLPYDDLPRVPLALPLFPNASRAFVGHEAGTPRDVNAGTPPSRQQHHACLPYKCENLKFAAISATHRRKSRRASSRYCYAFDRIYLIALMNMSVEAFSAEEAVRLGCYGAILPLHYGHCDTVLVIICRRAVFRRAR